MSLDDRIRADHAFIERCVTANHDCEREWLAAEIGDLEDRQRAYQVARRTLSERFAAASWAGERDVAALIDRQIVELEAHQP